MALTDSLILGYELEEASGNATDAVGSNTLTDIGSCGSTAGIVNNCRTLNGSSQFFRAASNSNFQTGDIDFSLAIWVYPTAFNGSFVMKGDSWSTFEYNLQYGSGGGGNFAWNVNSGSGSKTGGIGSGLNAWYFLACWHDSVNNILGFSVNDGTPNTVSYSGGVTTNTNAFSLGGGYLFDNPGSGPYALEAGYIDQYFFWKKVLSSSEITQLYNGGAGLAYSAFGGGGGGGGGIINPINIGAINNPVFAGF